MEGTAAYFPIFSPSYPKILKPSPFKPDIIISVQGITSDHIMATGNKCLAQMMADKPGSSGNDNLLHFTIPYHDGLSQTEPQEIAAGATPHGLFGKIWCKINEREKGRKGPKYFKIVPFKKGACPGKYKVVPKRKPALKGMFPQGRICWNGVPLFLLRLYNFQPVACIFHNLAFPMLAVARLDWSGRDILAGSVILE